MFKQALFSVHIGNSLFEDPIIIDLFPTKSLTERKPCAPRKITYCKMPATEEKEKKRETKLKIKNLFRHRQRDSLQQLVLQVNNHKLSLT